ncbi:MAG: hypothetical protein ACTHJO_00350 [Rhodanobacter sp.]
MNTRTIWELRCAAVNDHAMVVPLHPSDVSAGCFRVDGKPLAWNRRPMVGFADSTHKRDQRPPADVSAMVPGVLVLNRSARDVLGPFLSKFGQLLELEAEPGAAILYFFNVTRLVHCVDVERSEKNELGRIRLEAFDMSNVPMEPAVFKDPVTARSRIYINDGGKAAVETMVADAGLTGIECGRPAPSL